MILLCILAMVFGTKVYYDYESAKNIDLLFSTNVLEYGEEIDFTALLANSDKDLVVEAINYDPTVLGEQTVTFKVKNGQLKCNNDAHIFTVEDTQAPVIKLKKESVKVDYAAKFDPKSNVESVTDSVEGDIEYEVENPVNTSKSGNYTVKITATDANGNEASAEYKVTVAEKPVVKTTTTSSSYSSGTTSSVSSAYPMVYKDATATITVTKEWYKNAWCYVAHLQFTNYSRFGTANANNTYGGYETTSHAAARLGAILTVNGDYASPYLGYTVIRKGVIYNGADKNLYTPAVYSSNSGRFMDAYPGGGESIFGQNVASLVKQGLVTDSLCFGPPFIEQGQITNIYDTTSRAQRTFIGTNGNPGDIWVVVSDGRYNDGVSAGLTYRECAELLKSKGCTFGIPLDGGGSSTMVFRGVALNANGYNQRAVRDFVYFK